MPLAWLEATPSNRPPFTYIKLAAIDDELILSSHATLPLHSLAQLLDNFTSHGFVALNKLYDIVADCAARA